MEKNPDIYNKIVKNCHELVSTIITQQNLQYIFLNNLFIKANNLSDKNNMEKLGKKDN